MPMVIPHVPVGLQMAMNDADSDRTVMSRGADVRSPYSPIQGVEAEQRGQQIAQQGQYQTGELEDRRQQLQQQAVQQANELSEKAREFQKNAALRGQQISDEQALKMATLKMQQDKQSDLNDYRQSQLQDRAESMNTREGQDALMDNIREQNLALRGQSNDALEELKAAAIGAGAWKQQNMAKIAAHNKAIGLVDATGAAFGLDSKEYAQAVKDRDAAGQDLRDWNDPKKTDMAWADTAKKYMQQGGAGGGTLKPVPKSIGLKFAAQAKSKDDLAQILKNNGYDPTAQPIDDSTNTGPAQ